MQGYLVNWESLIWIVDLLKIKYTMNKKDGMNSFITYDRENMATDISA